MEEGKVKIHGKTYLTVSYRVTKFWENVRADSVNTYAIKTQMIENTPESVIFRCEITKNDNIVAIGHAHENKTGRINSTSAIENCETSAIGRALACFGLIGEEYNFCSANELSGSIERQFHNKTNKEKLLRLSREKGYSHLQLEIACKAYCKKTFAEIDEDDAQKLIVEMTKTKK